MFIYSFKASSLKLFLVISISVAALVVLLTSIPTYKPSASALMYSDAVSYNYDGVKTENDRIAFIKQFGWEVEEAPCQTQNVTIPGEFDKIYICYNELQRQQGLDLMRYKRKEVTRYTYKVTNYPDYNGTVYANIIVYRGRVVGCDLCSADVSGFVSTLDGKFKLP